MAHSLFRCGSDCYFGFRELEEEIFGESARAFWDSIADNEIRVWSIRILFREQVVGHFVPHAPQADEACTALASSEPFQDI